MKIAIFIILYIVGIILTGVYLYIKYKTESYTKYVDDTELSMLLVFSALFPIIYLGDLLVTIIRKIGDKLCKDQ